MEGSAPVACLVAVPPPMADAPAPPTACSRCSDDFGSGGFRRAGVCSTCPDGDALCAKCVAKHKGDARFSSHSWSPVSEKTPGDVLLEELALSPPIKACALHGGQPFLGIACSACPSSVATGDGAGMPGFCRQCRDEHLVAQPLHVFVPRAVVLRAKLREATQARIEECRDPPAASGGGVAALPLVACASHKATAARGALEALAESEREALRQIALNRAALEAMARSSFDTLSERVRTAAASKRAALQAEAASAEAALEVAVSETGVLLRAAAVLDDEDLAAHFETILARDGKARMAVDAVPSIPGNRISITVSVPALDRLECLITEAMGTVTTPAMPHTHTPHCMPPILADHPLAAALAPRDIAVSGMAGYCQPSWAKDGTLYVPCGAQVQVIRPGGETERFDVALWGLAATCHFSAYDDATGLLFLGQYGGSGTIAVAIETPLRTTSTVKWKSSLTTPHCGGLAMLPKSGLLVIIGHGSPGGSIVSAATGVAMRPCTSSWLVGACERSGLIFAGSCGKNIPCTAVSDGKALGNITLPGGSSYRPLATINSTSNSSESYLLIADTSSTRMDVVLLPPRTVVSSQTLPQAVRGVVAHPSGRAIALAMDSNVLSIIAWPPPSLGLCL